MDMKVYFLPILTSQIDVSTPCEAIACKIDLSKDEQLVVLTAYRPPNSDRDTCKTYVSLLRKFTYR